MYYRDALLEQTYNVVEMEDFILTEVIKTEGFPTDRFNGVELTEYFKLVRMLANKYFELLHH